MAAVDRRFRFSLFGDSVVYGNRLVQADTLPPRMQNLLRYEEKTKKALAPIAPRYAPWDLY